MQREPYAELRVACTALGQRIVLGKVIKGGEFVSDYRKDVTSDCLKAVIDKIGVGNVVIVEVDGVATYEISVKGLAS